MNAVLLNRILAGSIVLLVILTGVGFYYASQFLGATATQTDHATTDVTVATSNLEKLKRLESELEEKSEIVARTEQIVSEAAQYKYQDQIVQDVNAYARLAGVEVSGFTFAPEAAAGTAAPQSATSVTVPGVKKVEATVTLKSPLPYNNLLRFLVALEQNLTKMQVTGVNMVPDSKNKDAVATPTIGLQVYIKE